MELILWRHAEAEPGEPDAARILTPKGHKQAARMAEWLDASLPNSCRILASPAVRTVQTAQALGRKFKIIDALGTDSTVDAILQAVNWPDAREPVLIIGHQPTLGQLAARLIGGQQQDWTIRKGNVWWIAQRDPDDTGNLADSSGNYLRAMMSPDLARR